MTLLERLGRKVKKEQAVQEKEDIFAGRAVDAKEEEYQNLKLTVHRQIVDEMTAEQQRILDGTNHSREEIENVISGYVQRVLERIDRVAVVAHSATGVDAATRGMIARWA